MQILSLCAAPQMKFYYLERLAACKDGGRCFSDKLILRLDSEFASEIQLEI